MFSIYLRELRPAVAALILVALPLLGMSGALASLRGPTHVHAPARHAHAHERAAGHFQDVVARHFHAGPERHFHAPGSDAVAVDDGISDAAAEAEARRAPVTSLDTLVSEASALPGGNRGFALPALNLPLYLPPFPRRAERPPA